jgi:hypothetical protein
MKRLSILTICALTAYLPVRSSAQSPPVAYHITETDQGLTTDIPGATIQGAPDHWAVLLAPAPAGQFIFAPDHPPVLLAEPEDPTSENSLLFLNVVLLAWNSDLKGLPPGQGSPLTLGGAIIENGGVAPIFHDLIVADLADAVTPTPDGSPTILIFGLTVLGLMGAARLANMPRVVQLRR